MPTISMQIVAGVQQHTETRVVSGPDLLRFLAAYRSRYGEIGVEVEGGTTFRPRTDLEIIEEWMRETFRQTIAEVKRFEGMEAIRTAPPIPL